jgi:hypothetical protein
VSIPIQILSGSDVLTSSFPQHPVAATLSSTTFSYVKMAQNNVLTVVGGGQTE